MAGAHEASEADMVIEAIRVDELDSEALAYSRCMDALNGIPRIPHDALFALYVGNKDYTDTEAIRRVLLALSARFDCDLIQKPAEPKPPEPEVCDECGQEVE